MNFGTSLTFSLLFLTVIALWLPNFKGRPFWYLPFALSILAGLVSGHLSWIALGPLVLMQVAVTIKTRAVGIPLLLMTALGLGAHLFPGFHNPKVLDSVQISSDGIPFTLYLNFDKTVIGIFILGSLRPLLTHSKEWLGLLKAVLTQGVLIILGVAVFSLLLGFVHIDLKAPDSLLIWAGTNLLFVCVAEEAFFRGFIQKQLAERFGSISAMVIAGILFGVAHFAGGAKYMLLAAVAGLGYGWIYQRTKRIEASILTHFFLNLFHFLVLTYPALPNFSGSAFGAERTVLTFSAVDLPAYKELYQKIYETINSHSDKYEIRLKYLPVKRQFIDANEGVIDGVGIKAESNLESEQYVNLVKVPTPVLNINSIIAIPIDQPDIPDQKTLIKNQVLMLNGSAHSSAIIPMEQRVNVNSHQSGLLMIANKRAAAMSTLDIAYFTVALNSPEVATKTKLATYRRKEPFYIFVNKKNRRIVSDLDAIVKELESRHALQKIYDDLIQDMRKTLKTVNERSPRPTEPPADPLQKADSVPASPHSDSKAP